MLPTSIKSVGTASRHIAPQGAGEVRVCIAICTYRRPALLARALAALARQEFDGDFAGGPRPSVQVVVVDSAGDPKVRTIVEAFSASSGMSARYAVEACRGISQARNSTLELVAAEADFVAFIDDDEAPAPGWLQALLATQRRTGAAVVRGPVLPEFERPPPRWIAEGGFFRQPRRPVGSSITAPDGAPAADASTNNALVRMAEVRRGRLRFNVGFGLTGGEDVLFFRDLRRLGATMVWSPTAIVTEHVPARRATFAYLAREYFRCGNVRAAIEAMDAADLRQAPGSRRRAAGLIVRKALKRTLAQGGLLLATLLGGGSRARICGHLLELANAAGRLAYLCGYRYEHYR